MDLNTANRLYEYRKANGYSQEELAEKIGVSRQAISKWERSESSPDTDNLIALARLYKVSIDELINGTDKPEKAVEQKPEEQKEPEIQSAVKHEPVNEGVHFTPSGIDVQSAQGDTAHIGVNGVTLGQNNSGEFNAQVFKHAKKKSGRVSGVIWIGAVIIYLLLGFYTASGWAVGWIVFLLAVCLDTGIDAVKTKHLSGFAYPVLTVAFYCALGMAYSIWSPTWIVFLTIPIYYILCGAFAKSDSLQVSTKKAIISAVSVIMCVAICFTFLNVLNGSINGRKTAPRSTGFFNYDDDENYIIANQQVSLAGVNKIYVNWVNGSIKIIKTDDSEISFSENEQTDSDLKLRYKLENGRLNIRFCKSHTGFKWLESYSKELVIYVPNTQLNRLDINSVNADIIIEGITADELEIDNVNGNVSFDGVLNELKFDNVNAKSSFTFRNTPSK